MESVFLLSHSHELNPGEDDDKLIGVYRTRADAEAAQERAAKLPGFVDHPNGFIIDEYKLNEDNWIEGFVTVVHG